ncbi:MAG: glycosyltransferase family 2 protein [Pseudomonadota bacterium]|nr:glycosyltransferase family 2 protein [Pseudomonadota bacterium]
MQVGAWGAPVPASLLVAITALLALRLLLFVGAAAVELARRRRLPWPLDGELPRASVIVPAFNEERVLEGTVASLLASDHPDLEIILVDDGSTDATATLARALADRHPRVRLLLRPANGGKSAALNAGIAVATGAHIVTVDADTLLHPRALRRLCAPLVLPGVDAVASNVKVGNRQRWINVWQSLEYVVGLNLHRRGQAALGCITTIPGAACAFRREALAEVGGFSSDTVVEDTDLTLCLLEAGKRIVFQPTAVAYTESPDTIGGLFRQRTRWARGYFQCLWKHRRSFFRRDVLGWFGMPDLLLVNVLFYGLVPLSLPALGSLLGAASAGTVSWGALAGGVAGLFAVDLAVAAGAYTIDGEDLRELRHVPLRQLVWPWFLLAVFVVAAWRFLSGARGWGTPARQGVLAEAGKGGKTGVVR